jgi:hypothetical protein
MSSFSKASSGCTEATAAHSKSIVPNYTFIVLMAMNDFPDGYADIDLDFLNSEQLKTLFSDLGVPEENMLIKQDEMSSKDLADSFAWLELTAPENATVFFYIASHGSYIRNELAWHWSGPKKWNSLPQEEKVLIIDSCNSGEFSSSFETEPNSGITYAVTSADETSWWGAEDEGLPIIGNIWVHYFIEGISNPESDINLDGNISFIEATEYTAQMFQTYMTEEVFAVEEFLEKFERLYGYDSSKNMLYPNSVFNDHLDEDIILKVLDQ